ncbi:DEAD/DEAH box helicase [Jatrophihabitans sp. YIM 134969]
MSSPAERYQAAKARQRHRLLTEFSGLYPFELDDFQRESCEALEDGRGVLVCAPTGAGKTVVGEFAAHLALAQGGKCFYTTPIKALSNQKYRELVERYGPEQVGLLTGDVAVNADAPVVVMTTEIVRNMLYAGSDALQGLRYVVMDEVHYLGDRFRGGVWEEVIVHLPDDVALVSLSATVSNAEEFGEWLQTVRGDTAVVVHEERPVPLYQHMLVGRRLFDLVDGAGEVDAELRRAVDERRLRFGAPVRHGTASRGGRRAAPPSRFRPPDRAETIERLDREGLLPAITFVFSRAGCDAAVQQCLAAGLSLTGPAEREEIAEIAEAVTRSVGAADLEVLGYWEWLEGLRHGFAAHHAGLIPPFKQVVELLFTRGLVRAVFATETLALGINMPARSVVLERLVKFNGEAHVPVTPGEYTQLTGRAGRRGIDVEGHAIVVWSPDSDPDTVAGLASTHTYPLKSTFRPSYNTAVNLVDQLGRVAAREMLEQSFAQFQADRSVAGLAAQIRRNEQTVAAHDRAAACEQGDVARYAALRDELTDREKALSRAGNTARDADAVAALEKLRRGDVVRIPAGKRAGVAVVLDPGAPRDDTSDPRPLVLTLGRWAGRVPARDFPVAVDVLATLRVPRHFDHRSPQARRDLASALAEIRLPPPARPRARRMPDAATVDAENEIARLRRELRADPVHGCTDREEHLRWWRRARRLETETDGLRRRIEGRTGSLGRRFDRLCELLDERGYLDGDHATDDGRRLARLWSESDLLVAECLREGVWTGLDAAELAAVVSTLVYEPRRDEASSPPVPTLRVRDALAATTRVWGGLANAETAAGLPPGRGPEAGFALAIWRWATGQPLLSVLAGDGAVDSRGVPLPPGDFVRWAKQVLDLLDQVASAARGQADPVARTAAKAANAVRRGVVLTSVEG